MGDDDLLPPRKDKTGKLAYGFRRGGFAAPSGLEPVTFDGVGARPLFPVGPRAVPAAGGHWYSTGPGNLGGRIPALAIDPSVAADGKILYAGAASGGVWKTTDGGEHWRPLWRDQPSLSIAAIAVAPSEPLTVYVATGEPNAAPVVAGAGIYRSLDGGDHWDLIATAESLSRSFFFEALVVHPDDANQVWAVGPRGVFRTLDGRAAAPSFDAFDVASAAPVRAAVYYSDAAFGRAAAAPHAPILYLCRGRTERGEIVRIEAPGAPAATITAELANVNNRSRVFGAAGTSPSEPTTLRGKISICRDHPEVMYAAFAQITRRHVNRSTERELRGLVRCTTANGHGPHGFHNASWTNVPYRANENNGSDFWQEDQGEYNLVVAVSPTNADHLLFGMVTMYMTRNAHVAAPTWHPVFPWELWRIERGIHADQHVAVFEQHPAAGPTPAVWVGNDGGLVRCDDYATATGFIRDLVTTDAAPLNFNFRSLRRNMLPAAATSMHWRQRIAGLVATQAYDLTQSPLVPVMFGCGHQDNGVWFTAGGDTWRRALGADGGFVAWDPVDPYHFLATWQSGLSTIDFAGGWDAAVPAPNEDMMSHRWPRTLTAGFHPLDPSRFVADTVHHPRIAGRIATTRAARAYLTRDGESFAPLELGDVVELVATHTFPQPAAPDPHGAIMRFVGMILLEVVGGTGAAKLGLFRSVAFETRNRTTNAVRIEDAPNPTRASRALGTNLARLRTLFRGPYALADGDTLQLRAVFRDRAGAELDVTLPTVTFHAGNFAAIARATAPEVARAITAALGTVFSSGGRTVQVTARPVLHGPALSVEIVTNRLAPDDPDPLVPSPATPTIRIGGDAAVLTALGVVAGTYRGIRGRPAMVTLQTHRLDNPDFLDNERLVAVPSGGKLEVTIDGGRTDTLTFASPPFADLSSIRAHELARELDALFRVGPAVPAVAVAVTVAKSVVVFRDDHATVPDAPTAAASTALAPLTAGNAPPGRARATSNASESPRRELELRFTPRPLFNAYALHPSGADLELRLAGAGGSTDVRFDAASFVDRHRATAEEVVARIRRALPAARHLRCELVTGVGIAEPSELAFGHDEPAALWVGADGGQVYLSTDDGVSFTAVADPRMGALERTVEAITIDPTDPRVVYVGLGGVGNGAHDPGTLWKTTDRGAAWAPIGRAELVEVDGGGVATTTPLGINEIVIDPADSRRLWVATTAGVFESGDAGASFHAFSEGLANCEVVDLAFVPGRRMLRCALWGRGTYARDVSPAAAQPAVHLYLRTSLLDDGSVRPADDGLDGFATTPTPALRWLSPDIKVTRAGLRDLAPTVDDFDAVELDEELTSDPVGRQGAAADPYQVYVLVHNRSARPSVDTRVIVAWADCSRGIPELPASLWATIGGPTTIDPPWHAIGETVLTGETTAARPRVARVTFTPPADLAATADRIGILALVTSAADGLTAGPTSVPALLERERRAGFRLVSTRAQREVAQLVLHATDGRPFTVADTPVGWTGLATAVAVTAQRGTSLAVPLDLSAAPVRELRVVVAQPPPEAPREVVVQLTAGELRRFGADPAAVTPADLRRILDHHLRLGAIGVRCTAAGVELSVDGGGRAAELIARDTAFADLTAAGAAIASGDALTLGTLKRSTTNHLYARLRNRGPAPEPAATWRAYWFAADAPVRFDAAHQLATGTVALGPGAATVVDFTHDPGAATVARGVVVWLASEGDPLHAPLREPPTGPAPELSVVELDAYCAGRASVAYRIFEVVP